MKHRKKSLRSPSAPPRTGGHDGRHGGARGQTGPSTTTAPYLVPTQPGVGFRSILTAGDQVRGYTMAGTDGLGAFDNGTAPSPWS
ncbi:MAG: hypothetical protein R2726_16595 [Acidimicrobiales bacterium]